MRTALPTLEVLIPGFQTTIQDLGRVGYEHIGMPPSGAMDTWASSVANILVGNPRDAALLETTLTGPTLRILRDTVIALSGARFAVWVDNGMRRRPLQNWASAIVRAGETLQFGLRESGARGYLAIAGGINVPAVLGSRSTFLRGQMGGHLGRALRSGDRLETFDTVPGVRGGIALRPQDIPNYPDHVMLRVMRGPHAALLTAAGRAAVRTGTYTVLAQSDRMGMRWHGPLVDVRVGVADLLLSEATPPGALQIAGDGQPLLLMADRQTTGGYPIAAIVVRADLPCAAQLLPGQPVSFCAVSLQAAQEALRRQEALLRFLETAAAAMR